MPSSRYVPKGALMHCKCGLCNHKSRESCINGHCYCCDLEDMFVLLSRQEFEPQSKTVTSFVQKRNEKTTDMIVRHWHCSSDPTDHKEVNKQPTFV